MKEVGKQLAKLIDLKSIATLLMTGTMIALLFYPKEINKELSMLFSTTYGSMMTYYYNRKGSGNNNE